MANEERHCFITEWYDSHAEIKRRYQLMHYLKVHQYPLAQDILSLF